MASIDEPFLLSSYSIDNEATHDPYVLQASRLVYVTNNDGKASQTKQKAHRSVAVVSVQRNGVHLIDVADQSPLASYTVSPRTVFSCAAVSISYSSASVLDEAAAGPSTYEAANALRHRKTFVGVKPEEGSSRCELWCWTEQERKDGSSEGEAVKTEAEFDSEIVSLNASQIPQSVLVCTADGNIHTIAWNLAVRNTISMSLTSEAETGSKYNFHWQPSMTTRTLPFLHIVSASDVFPLITTRSVVPQSKAKNKKADKKGRVRSADDPDAKFASPSSSSVHFLALHPHTSELRRVGCANLPAANIVDAVMTSHGHVTTLSLGGELHTFKLDRSNDSVRPKTLENMMDLQTNADEYFHAVSVRVQRLASTALQITTCGMLALPASLSDSVAATTDIPSETAVSDLAVVVGLDAKANDVRLFLYNVPYGLILADSRVAIAGNNESVDMSRPLRITLARFDYATIAVSAASISQTSVSRATLHAVSCTVPVSSVLADLVGKQQQYMHYITQDIAASRPPSSVDHSERSDPAETEELSHILERMLTNQGDIQDPAEVHQTFETYYERRSREARGDKASVTGLPPRVIRKLLALAVPLLSDPNITRSVLAKTTIDILLVNENVMDCMYTPPGLVAGTCHANQAETLSLAVKNLMDITEDSLMNALRAVIGRGLEGSVPNLAVVCDIVNHRTTPAALKSAMKARLRSQELLEILPVLALWLEDGDMIKGVANDAVGASRPRMDRLLMFLTCMLDAHLVTMMQTPALRPMLEYLRLAAVRQSAFSRSIQGLREPIRQIDAADKKQREAKAELREIDAQYRKWQRINQRALAAGKPPQKIPYTLVQKLKTLTKEQGFERKKSAKTKQLQVGDYQVEEFVL